MRINNKGFAISSMMYSILLLFLILVLGVLAVLGSRKVILDKVKNEIFSDLGQTKSYSISFEHRDILLANTSKVANFSFDLLDGVNVIDQNGNVIDAEISTLSSPNFDSTTNGIYHITYKATYNGLPIEADRRIEVIDPLIYEYAYKNSSQQFTVPVSGIYRAELWGAQGGNISGASYKSDNTVRNNSVLYTGGKGAYTVGDIALQGKEVLYLYIGGMPILNTTLTSGAREGGYNGGGSLTAGQEIYGVGGGGASDIRLVDGAWDNFDSLKSRIMVAAGGGGANFRNQGYGEGNGGEGGTLTGVNGYEALIEGTYWRSDYSPGYGIGIGATQTSGGMEETHYLNGTIEKKSVNGTFGGAKATLGQSGGGGGYYSGGSASHGGAAGGSSFISGYSGCDAIKEESLETSIAHTGQSVHYSGIAFTNGNMISGKDVMPSYDGTTMTGNSGNGHAKITALIIDQGKVAANLVSNSSFEGNESWTLSNAQIVGETSKTSTHALELQPNVSSLNTQSINAPIAGHIYYGSFQFLSSSTFTASSNYFDLFTSDTDNGKIVFTTNIDQTSRWKKLSNLGGLTAPASGNWLLRTGIVGANEKVYIDDIFLIDLTEIYGAGKEPSKDWCDINITYFDGIGIVPNY